MKGSGKESPGPPREKQKKWNALSVSSTYRTLFGNRKILVATHREPVQVLPNPGDLPVDATRPRFRLPVGGVSQSLHRLLLQVGGDWVSLRSSPGPDRLVIELPVNPAHYDLTRIDPDSLKDEASYNAFSNDVLWPLFHGEPTRTLAEAMERPDRFFQAYVDANRIFARTLEETRQKHPAGLLWVHDYQLALVAQAIRSSPVRDIPPLSFFWHIPWPESPFLALLPFRRTFLSGLLDYDHLGFQTDQDRNNFLDEIAREFVQDRTVEIRGTTIRKDSRTIEVGGYPIGVDPDRLERLSQDPEGIRQAKLFLEQHGMGGSQTFLISVDRMDYTKGFLKRLLILEALFCTYPEWIGTLRLLQIAPPTRTSQATYRAYQERVREEVESLNRRWRQEDGWTPVLSLETNVDHAILAPLYRMAAGALVTSTRDGMNLVAKEYLSSQKDAGGVLFLSRHTGAARGLREVVLIDPFEPEQSAQAIHRALNEPLKLRRDRNARLREQLAQNNIYRWMGTILESVAECGSRE